MKAAIRSEKSVVLFEYLLLYNLKERIPDEEYVLWLERLRWFDQYNMLQFLYIRAWGIMWCWLQRCWWAKLWSWGYQYQITETICLYTIGNSIKKTHWILIVEKCMRTGGISANLRSAVIGNFWDFLDVPIICLSSQVVLTPYAGTLN